jgi:hypothetical protein
MKAYGGVDVRIHIFLNSALVGGEWSAPCHYHFTPGDRVPGTQFERRLDEPQRSRLDFGKILRTEIRVINFTTVHCNHKL